MRLPIRNVGEVMSKRRTKQTEDLLKRSSDFPSVKMGKGVKKATRTAAEKRSE